MGTTDDKEFSINTILTEIFRTHHTCVLAATYDHWLVRREIRSGARKIGDPALLEAALQRVKPFCELRTDGSARYTSIYQNRLEFADITLSPDIHEHG